MQHAILPLLGVLFVGLKLTDNIDWSWWWVTLPFWGGLALFGLMFMVFVIGIPALGMAYKSIRK